MCMVHFVRFNLRRILKYAFDYNRVGLSRDDLVQLTGLYSLITNQLTNQSVTISYAPHWLHSSDLQVSSLEKDDGEVCNSDFSLCCVSNCHVKFLVIFILGIFFILLFLFL